MAKTKKKEIQKQGLRPSQKAKAEKLLKKQEAKKLAANLLLVSKSEVQNTVSNAEPISESTLSSGEEKKSRVKKTISLTKDKKIIRKTTSAVKEKKNIRKITTEKSPAEEVITSEQITDNNLPNTEPIATITVKNAEGDPDTVAEILIQNKIDYTPKVSVVIPVYNVEAYLHQTMDTVIQQTLREIEIICVDDGSTDASLDILKEYASKDNRITVITQKNAGSGKARNNAINNSNGEFIAFMDSDDMYPNENTLEHMYKAAIENDVLVCGGSLSQLREGGIIVTDPKEFEDGYSFKEDRIVQYSDYQFDYGYWRFIFNRKFLKENQLYFPDYIRCQDPPFFVKTMCMAETFYALKEPTYVYRVSYKQISWNERKAIDVYKARVDILDLCDKYHLDKLYQIIVHHMSSEWLINQLVELLEVREVKNYIKLSLEKVNVKKITDYKILREYYKTTIELNEDKIYEKAVSIVIPVYNVEKYLRQCLNSAISQTLKNIEIVCINDESPDNSLEILKEYASKDNRIVIINQKNQGLSGSRNNALKIVKGKYVLFLDSDDYLQSDATEILYTNMEQYQLDMLSFSGINFNNETNEESINDYWEFNYLPKEFGYKKFNFNDCAEFIQDMAVTSCLTVYRTDLIRILKLEFPEHLCFEDNVFFLKSITLARNCGICKDKFYHRRIHGASITQNWDKHFADFIKISDLCLEYVSHIGVKIFEKYKAKYLNGCIYRYNLLTRKSKKMYMSEMKKIFDKYNYGQDKIKYPVSYWKAYLLFPYYLIRIKKIKLEYTTHDILNQLQQYRIDIKNVGTATNAVEVISNDGYVTNPKWFTDMQGVGKLLQGKLMNNAIKIKIINDGILCMMFRGQDKRLNSVRYPLWIDYKSIKIDGKEILSMPIATWHDEPYRYEIPVNDGQEITLKIEQQYHQYAEDELKNIVTKLNPNNDYIAKNLDKISDVLYSEIHSDDIVPAINVNKKTDNKSSKNEIKVENEADIYWRKLNSSRVDIKNVGTVDNGVLVTSENGNVIEPKYLSDEFGVGKVVQSTDLHNIIKIKSVNSGVLKIYFRGQDKRFDNKRLPLWIDYKSIKINDKEILSKPIETWHDKSYYYEMPVKDGQEIKLEVTIQNHKYTLQDMYELISKLFAYDKNFALKKDSVIDYICDKYDTNTLEFRHTWPYVKNEILNKVSSPVTIDDISKDTKGLISIDVGNTKFEGVLLPHNNKKLYVFLSASGNKQPYPLFHRISWCDYFNDGIGLYLDDPTRHENRMDSIAFYFGKKDDNYLEYICQIIRKVMRVYEVYCEDVTFISSSNGGFAALYCADKIKGSKCIVSNPQVDIPTYVGKNSVFEKVFDIDFSDENYKDRINVCNILSNTQSKFFIFCNIKCRLDKPQIELLCKHANKAPSLGYQKLTGNVEVLIADIDYSDPHLCQADENFVRFIEKHIGEDRSDEYNLFVNEMKRYYATLQKVNKDAAA